MEKGNKENSKETLTEALQRGKSIYIKCGENHRFIGLWPVVVEGRIFVRSWSLSKNGWYRAFLAHPMGQIRVKKKEIRIHTRPVKSVKINALINEAFSSKYTSHGELKYVKGLNEKPSVSSTLEIIPIL